MVHSTVVLRYTYIVLAVPHIFNNTGHSKQ